MKILTVTTLFPNGNDLKHGVFIKNRLVHLVEDFKQIDAKVIAPVPWFPIRMKSGPLAEYAKYVGVKSRETVEGLDVYHPRYLVIPKIGMYITPIFLFLSVWFCARQLKKQGFDYEVIDGHYFFPDGVAVAMLSKVTKVPAMISARGSDIHQIANFPIARKAIRWAVKHSAAVAAVCKALLDSIRTFSDVNDKGYVLRNGVDLNFFELSDDTTQRQCKEEWGVEPHRKLIVCVGRLIELKGHHLVIEALLAHPDSDLIIAGDGPEQINLEKLIKTLDLSSRVRLAGPLVPNKLKRLYQAADAMVLASSREGWANVLLEAMACGTPVVATNLWGTPEVVGAKEAGVLVERSVEALSEGIHTLFSLELARADTRRYAEGFDWYETSKAQFEIFTDLLSKGPKLLKAESRRC